MLRSPYLPKIATTIPEVSVVVRFVRNRVIIERDQNDKLVLDALLQAGIPRSQIILAYAGEPVPETAV